MLFLNPEGPRKNRRERKHKQFRKPRERKHLEDDKKLTRREFLKIGFGILAFTVLGYILKKFLFSKKPEDEKIKKNVMAEIELKINDLENKKEFEPNQKIELQLDPELSDFVKKNNLSDLIKSYFDFDKEKNKENNEEKNKEKNKEKINPVKILERLWEIKISNLEEGDEEIKKILEELKGKIIQDYQDNPGAKIKINEFLNYLTLCIAQSLLLIDFEKLSKKFNFSEEQKEIIEIILKDKEFIKYLNISLLIIILNEISFCSKNNPQINLKTLEYLLNNFGLNFLTAIPAIFDKRISFGPFQLTDLVVGINNKETTYPISFINECLNEKYPSYQLPFKLEEFRKKQHYIGEVFLCLYYLCRYVEKLNKSAVNYLKTTIKYDDKKRKVFYEDLLSMFCACHYGGQSVLKKFVKEKREFNAYVKDYLNKAEINLETIKNLLGE